MVHIQTSLAAAALLMARPVVPLKVDFSDQSKGPLNFQPSIIPKTSLTLL